MIVLGRKSKKTRMKTNYIAFCSWQIFPSVDWMPMCVSVRSKHIDLFTVQMSSIQKWFVIFTKFNCKRWFSHNHNRITEHWTLYVVWKSEACKVQTHSNESRVFIIKNSSNNLGDECKKVRTSEKGARKCSISSSNYQN